MVFFPQSDRFCPLKGSIPAGQSSSANIPPLSSPALRVCDVSHIAGGGVTAWTGHTERQATIYLPGERLACGSETQRFSSTALGCLEFPVTAFTANICQLFSALRQYLFPPLSANVNVHFHQCNVSGNSAQLRKSC